MRLSPIMLGIVLAVGLYTVSVADESVKVLENVHLSKQQQAINHYIDSLNTPFDPDLLKAIAWVESNFTQTNKDGSPFVDGSLNRGSGRISRDVGVFQLNEDTLHKFKLTKRQMRRVRMDANFNICMGVSILESKMWYIKKLKKQKNWKQIERKYGLKGMSDLDMAILAYNGIQRDKVYLRLVKKFLKKKPWQGDKVVQLGKL